MKSGLCISLIVLVAGLLHGAQVQLAPSAALNPARPHIQIFLGTDPPLIQLYGTREMSGPPLVVVDDTGLHANGRLVCSWPGGRYDGSAPGGQTDMVLGYRDRVATQYEGCRADVPIISTWYEEFGRHPRLFLEVISRSGSIARLRSKTRDYFLDVRTLPGCPRTPDPVDDVECDRPGAWEWHRSQQDEDLRTATNLAMLGGDRSFVDFLRNFRECV